MKKLLSTMLVAGLTVSLLAGCSSNAKNGTGTGAGAGKSDSSLMVGVILAGDETESYTKAHIDGIKEAAKEVGISEDKIKWKTRVEESDKCKTAAKELAADGCNLVIANSYGHENYIEEAAEENEDVNFVSMTGDYAAICGLDNFYNAFTDIYESRYVSGVVAGMKLAELDAAGTIPAKGYDENHNVKVGYVGAFPYAEVVSGYTAFYLGIKSVFPNVVMDVDFTNAWFDIDKEAKAADLLMQNGCVIIGQHADSTGAPRAVQSKKDAGEAVYFVGYNADMVPTAETSALTSTVSVWSVYYKELFEAALAGKEIPKDWSKGYNAGAVAITQLGSEAAAGTAEKAAEVEAAIKAGTLHVFDTSTFTVDGKELTELEIDFSYKDYSSDPDGKVIYEGETENVIKTDDNGVSYFDESSFRSAPYFNIDVDGITKLKSNDEQ